MARVNLESVVIKSFVVDEHTINTQWLYSNVIGGVRLMVFEDDFEEATDVLTSYFSESFDKHFEAVGEKQDICPH